MRFKLLFFLLICAVRVPSFAQYYPALSPVPPDQFPALLRQDTSFSFERRAAADVALANLYLNLPRKKTADLARARSYGRRALVESVTANDRVHKDEALVLLGQLYFVEDAPDSIAQLMDMADDQTKAKLLLQLSFYYWYIDSPNKKIDCSKSLAYAKQAMAITERLGLPDLNLLARRNIAMDNVRLKKDTTESELFGMLRDYKRAGYTQLHYVYFVLALDYLEINNLPKAYYYSEAAVRSAVETRDTLAMGDMYLIKGEVDYQRENYNEAVRSGQAALKFYGYRSGMCGLYTPDVHQDITAAYDKMGKTQEAVDYMVDVMHRYPPRTAMDSMKYLERIGHAYRELKRFDLAEAYFQQLWVISKRTRFSERTVVGALGQLFIDAKQYGKAREYLYKALGMPTGSEGAAWYRLLQYRLYLADSATGHYLSAIQHLNICNDQGAAEVRVEKDKLVKQMEVRFKAEEQKAELNLKNQNIALLQKQSEAQKEKLKQSETISKLIAGGFALALIILILLGFLYQQKQRAAGEMSQKNQQLHSLVSEKDWLLKEVHHRVKNNLHTIFCLLESQARTASPEARTALEKSQHRIYAMSLFHQKAYQSENIELVDFGNYLRDFLLFLEEGFDLEVQNVRIVHDMDAVVLPLALAMPLALIANEALTNAAKYAFEGREGGEIRISLKQRGEACCLSIVDNGVGMPGPNPALKRSLGMQLMHGLCTDIGADIRFDTNDGTRITITFKNKSNHEEESIDRRRPVYRGA